LWGGFLSYSVVFREPFRRAAGLTSHRKVRREQVREEITASPFSDGYLWRKYGQKNIQNKEFAR
jgi:hypothetical protein